MQDNVANPDRRIDTIAIEPRSAKTPRILCFDSSAEPSDTPFLTAKLREFLAEQNIQFSLVQTNSLAAALHAVDATDKAFGFDEVVLNVALPFASTDMPDGVALLLRNLNEKSRSLEDGINPLGFDIVSPNPIEATRWLAAYRYPDGKKLSQLFPLTVHATQENTAKRIAEGLKAIASLAYPAPK